MRRFFALIFLLGSIGTAAAASSSQPAPKMNVVLVHGFLNSGKMFGPMVRALEAEGYACYAPDLTPNDCRLGVSDLTRKLAAGIDARFGPTAPVVLVGFSMGGVISRDYVENVVRNRRRVRGVFLIASGGKGTLWANLSPNAGQREMAIGSPFLRALNADETVWKTVPLRAYWTPFDLMIVPAVNSRWPVGHATRILCPVHPWMVRDRQIIADIITRLHSLPTSVPPNSRSNASAKTGR